MKRQSVPKEKKKEVNISQESNWGIFVYLTNHTRSLFSLNFKEKTFWLVRRKDIWAPLHFFISPSQPNTLQKVFYLHFLNFFFPIFPKIHSTKHTLKLQLYSIFFYWRQLLINPPLDYIFFLYPPYLSNFKKIKDQ